MFSSLVTSLEDLLDPLSVGRGGGERLLFFFPVGVMDLADFLEPRETLRDNVRYGVSPGVGRDAGPADSSSVSHAAMMNCVRGFPRSKARSSPPFRCSNCWLACVNGGRMPVLDKSREPGWLGSTAMIPVGLDQALSEGCFKVKPRPAQSSEASAELQCMNQLVVLPNVGTTKTQSEPSWSATQSRPAFSLKAERVRCLTRSWRSCPSACVSNS